MQSWGTRSRFDERETDHEPSKSGVLGLLCAALGIDRGEWTALAPLAELRMGVRVDQPGILRYDYHTAQERTDEHRSRAAVTKRFYLADAVFLVGLEGQDRGLLERTAAAVKNPHWPLFLGRKSFVPSQPACLEDGGVRDERLEVALANCSHVGGAEEPAEYRFALESSTPQGSLRMDQPIASFAERRFGGRYVFSVVSRKGEVPRVPV